MYSHHRCLVDWDPAADQPARSAEALVEHHVTRRHCQPPAPPPGNSHHIARCPPFCSKLPANNVRIRDTTCIRVSGLWSLIREIRQLAVNVLVSATSDVQLHMTLHALDFVMLYTCTCSLNVYLRETFR